MDVRASRLPMLAVALLLGACGEAQSGGGPELVAVPQVDLARFEPGMQDAIRNALADTERLSDAEPEQRAVAFGRLGMLFHAHDLLDLAEPCYINAERLAPEQHQWPYLLGILYQVEGRLEQAVEKYRRSLVRKPGFLPALLHLGQAHNSLGESGEAATIFRESLALDQDNAVALEGLGTIARREGRFEDAVRYFSHALRSDPEASRLHYLLGMAYRGLGDLDKAREHLALRGTRNPVISDPALAAMQAMLSTSQHHIKRGLAAYEAGDFETAVAAYRAALNADPDDLETRTALAWVLELTGDPETALAEIETVLTDQPDSRKALYMKGALLAARDENQAAIAPLEAAVRLAGDAAPPRLVLATALMRSGRYEQAAEHYQWLAGAAPGDVVMQYRLGMAQLAAGRCEAAITPLEQALGLRPGSATLTQALLRAYSICPASDVHREAAMVQGQRLFDQTRRWESAATLAMALAANGRFEEAASLQQTVLEQARSRGESLVTLRALADNLQRYEAGQPAETAWPAGASVYMPPVITARDRLQLEG